MPFLALIVFVVMVAALIDAITRRSDQIKHLPKLVWILLIVIMPFIGSVLWFAIGREWGPQSEAISFGDPRRWSKSAAAPAPVATARPARETRTTEQQLADLEAEMRIAELEAEVRRRRSGIDPVA